MLMRANCPHAASSFETPRNGAVDGDGVGTVAGEFVVAGAGATVGWLRGQNITAKITTTISAAIACQKRLSWKKSIATSRIGAVATCVGCDRLSGGARLSDHRARRQFVAKLISCLATLLALAAAVDFGHAQAVGDPKRRPRLGAAGLLAVSRDGRWAGSLAKFAGTEISRPCNHPWDDEHRVVGRSHHASRGYAHVHAHGRTAG